MLAHLARLLPALALACAGLVLTGTPAQACACVDGSVARQARQADVVFSGVLRAQERRARQQVYTLDVERVYQGRIEESPVEVVSSTTTNCGLGDLRVDRGYVVFATGASRLASTQCTGTGRATPAYVEDVERVLGPGAAVGKPSQPSQQPQPPEYTRVADTDPPQFTRLAAPGAALVLVGLLGLVLVRKRG